MAAAGGQLVRLLNTHSILHASHRRKNVPINFGQIAHQRDDRMFLAVDGVGADAYRSGFFDDGSGFGCAGSGFHNDDHWGFLRVMKVASCEL